MARPMAGRPLQRGHRVDHLVEAVLEPEERVAARGLPVVPPRAHAGGPSSGFPATGVHVSRSGLVTAPIDCAPKGLRPVK